MNALILAAGYATRLYPLTLDTPKPLLPVAGRPVLDYMLDELRAIPGLRRVIVVTNHRLRRIWHGGRKRPTLRVIF